MRNRCISMFLCITLMLSCVPLTAFAVFDKTTMMLACEYGDMYHEHTSFCYDADGILQCGYSDEIIHRHNFYCYNADGDLICTLPEIGYHEHDDSCYEKRLVCGFVEDEKDTDVIGSDGDIPVDDSSIVDIVTDETIKDAVEDTDEESEFQGNMPEADDNFDDASEIEFDTGTNTEYNKNDAEIVNVEENALIPVEIESETEQDVVSDAEVASVAEDTIEIELPDVSALSDGTYAIEDDFVSTPSIDFFEEDTVDVVEENDAEVHEHTDACYELVLVCENDQTDWVVHQHSRNCWQEYAITTFAAMPDLPTGETVMGDPETIKIASQERDAREVAFNSDWRFHLGDISSAYLPAYNDSSWESVDVPHDFSISQDFTTTGEAESGFLPGGTGWYRKTFVLPRGDEGCQFLIEFDGVYEDAYIYVNGVYVGENHYGYSNFAFDLTDYLVCDGVTENVLAVKVVHNVPSSRWYSGSGIYRDVTLYVMEDTHIDWNGIEITTPNISFGDGTANISVSTINQGMTDTDVYAVANICRHGSTAVVASSTSNAVTVASGTTENLNLSVTVSNPQLWSVDSPKLYDAIIELYANDELVDTETATFGYRWYSFDSETGFSLNGEPLKLNGVCLHNDQGALGSAAYTEAIRRQLEIMKDMGVNAIRTSHNPADEDFLTLCSELGIMVMEEMFDGWAYSKNGNSNDFAKWFNVSLSSDNGIYGGSPSMTWAEYAVKSIVRRDRNQASVIMWSLCNEVQEGASQDSNYPIYCQNIINWIKETDAFANSSLLYYRPTTLGDNNRATSDTYNYVTQAIRVLIDNGGIAGFNYATADALSKLHNYWGTIYSSETSSAVNSRSQYSGQGSCTNLDGLYHLTSYDTSTVAWGTVASSSLWNTLTLDYVAGEFVWTGFDYIGEPTPWNGTGTGSVSGSGAIPNTAYFGIVDTAGFPKDTYYLYRSQWNKDSTTLHLVTAWDSDNMMTVNGQTPVVIYSNAPVVKLYKDGSVIGTARREVHTTAAGYRYYTYTVTADDPNNCTAVTSSNGTSLYATFNVTFSEGTISAKAFQADEITEITNTTGTSSVTTAADGSVIKMTAEQSHIDADGHSISYIGIDVLDENGNLDTAATNLLTITLSGNGKIVGVDNGDQATTQKFQQRSALISDTKAQIHAYAGKALVIVQSTEDAGTITVSANGSGLDGDTVSVYTSMVFDDDEEAREGIVSCTLIRDYSVYMESQPVFDTSATVNFADGTTISGMVVWDTNALPSNYYKMAGDYTITGIVTATGYDDIPVTGKIHVVASVIAMRNEATATLVSTVPVLPSQVVGLMADGTQIGAFDVEWETVDESMFSTVGDIVVVNGIASMLGSDSIPVTCSVRVAEGSGTTINVAPNASSLTQDCVFTSDTLESVNNRYKESVDNTSERWTNWNNRTTSDTATLTFEWDTAQLIDTVNIQYYYDNCSAYPEDILFQYSLDGITWISVDVEETTLLENQSYGAEYEYKLSEVINPIAFRTVFTQQGGVSGAHCVGVIEMELMTPATYVERENDATLTGLTSGGIEIEDFDPDTVLYTASNEDIAALAESNVGITVLPIYEDYVRVVTVSEDGAETRTYVVYIGDEEDLENYTVVSGMYMWMHLYGYSDTNGWALNGQNTILASWTPNSVGAIHHQANTYEDTVTYTDDDGQMWYLIPVSTLTKIYGNYGFDFDPSYCPILYAPNAYYTDAQDCLYADWYYRGDNATWYLRTTHTGDYGNVRLNLYYVPLTVVDDAANPSSTTINLFDYWLTTQDGSDSQLTSASSGLLDMGINYGHPFKFTKNPGASIADGSFNKWTGSAAPKTGIVKNVLSEAYPILTGDTTIGMTENDVESLNYLFDPNMTTAYRAAYTDVKGLLSMDSNGYYTYNSYQQQAWYNEATNNIVRYAYPGTAAGSGTSNQAYGQFFPLQKPELTAVTHCESENINHYFGMTMTTHFIQSDGGYLTDERKQPSLFEFSGDDDVWIFIDNVLVADLGGIHDTTSVSIDFVTGSITVNEDTNYETTSTLRAAFETAMGAENLTESDWSGETFADNTSHTMQFFYLERGNEASNLSLRFNMKAMPEDTPELPETGGPGVFTTTVAGIVSVLTATCFLIVTNWETRKRRK